MPTSSTVRFDLTADPLETTDIAGDPKNAVVISELKDMLITEMLLRGNRSAYCDYDAPVVSGKTHENPDCQGFKSGDFFAEYKRKNTTRPLTVWIVGAAD